jgi:hypothetical protein
MNPGSIGNLDFYLRAKLRTKKAIKWCISLEHEFQQVYPSTAVQNVKDYVNTTGPCQGLPKCAS